MDRHVIRPVAHIRSDYNEKFGIPKQCGLVTELEQAVVIEPEFRNLDLLRDIEKFEYIWLIWGFSGNRADGCGDAERWTPTVRPPRLGGSKRVGVWASRSPYRPNGLGLSSVRFHRIEINGKPVRSDDISGPVRGELAVIISGGDMMNGTPVFDIKPYLPFSDCHADATDGYSKGTQDPCLEVIFPDELLNLVDEDKRAGLMHALTLDPRGAYDKKQGYEYGMSFADWDIRFTVQNNTLTVSDVAASADITDKIK